MFKTMQCRAFCSMPRTQIERCAAIGNARGMGDIQIREAAVERKNKLIQRDLAECEKGDFVLTAKKGILFLRHSGSIV